MCESLEALYAELNPQLLLIVRSNLSAPEGLLEDVCQMAWSALMLHREQVTPGGELGWLSTTATRLALRQMRGHGNEVSYEEPDQDHRQRLSELPDQRLGPDEVIELRERLTEVRGLPARQARMVWMRGLGYDYHEIAALTGDSWRTVERQLRKAGRSLARGAGG